MKWLRASVLPWLKRNILLVVFFALLAVAIGWSVKILQPVLAIPLTDDTAIPVLVAGIAVTGALTNAVVVLVGHLLRQSLDLRNTRLAEEAGNRAAADQKRLQAQAAMETIKLLTRDDATPAAAVQVSAALIVLSKLGEIGLALDLAAEMWPAGHLTPRSAVYLCNSAIATDSPDLQRSAAILIYNNWDKLGTGPGQFQWLSIQSEWPAGLDAVPREIITRALEAWLVKVPGDDFRKMLVDESGRLGRQEQI